MNIHPFHARLSKFIHGSIWMFLAESLSFPIGILTVMYLSHRLGPESYGLYALSVAFIVWIEWSLVLFFSSASIKFVSESDPWQIAGKAVLNLYFLSSVLMAFLIWNLTPFLSTLFHDPSLTFYFRFMCLDIPLFGLAFANRIILIGTGQFKKRAFLGAFGWVFRLGFIVLFVELGYSIRGAILGCIISSLMEWLFGLWCVRLSPFGAISLPPKKLFTHSGLFFFSTVNQRLFGRVDLFLLKALSIPGEIIGHYAAAQNFSLTPTALATTFSPLFLSTLTQTKKTEGVEKAKELAWHTLRAVLWLLPFAAMLSGCSKEIILFVLGPAFLPSEKFLTVLIFSMVTTTFLSASYNILFVGEKPFRIVLLTGIVLSVAVILNVILIPHYGARVAPYVMVLSGGIGCLLAMFEIHRLYGLLPPFVTILRSAIISVVTYFVARLWPSQNGYLLLKMLVISSAIFGFYLLLGEFKKNELKFLLSTLNPMRGQEEV